MTEAADGGSALSLLADREFVALSGTAFARSQAYSTILIALALYADVFETTGTIEGLFGAGFAFVQLLIVLPLGRAIDTGNAKRYLLAGLLVNVGVFGGFMLVESAVHVVLVRMLQGIGASLLWITGSTVVGEISPDDARGRWLGTYNQVGAFSSLAGDLVGGYLLYAHGFRLTYLILSAITLLVFVLVYRYLRENPGQRKDPEEATGVETLRTLLGRPVIRALVVFRATFSMGKMIVIIFLPIYARTSFGISPLSIGFILAGGKLTKSLLQGWMGDLTDAYGRASRHRFVAAGALLYAVGATIIPAASYAEATFSGLTVAAFGRSVTVSAAFATLFVAFAIIGVGDSLRLPASMALFVEEGERFDSVAASFSLRSIVWKFGQILGPALAGLLKDAISPLASFWTATVAILVATGAFLALHARSATPGREPAPAD